MSTVKKKGFLQVKRLCRFNYHKTYLGTIIEDDARNVNIANTIIRHSSGQAPKSIFEINNDNSLDENAGLFFIKLTQPTGENIKQRSNFEFIIKKHATPIEQDTLVTNKIKAMIKEPANFGKVNDWDSNSDYTSDFICAYEITIHFKKLSSYSNLFF